MVSRDKVAGMFWGIAIGDALGMPVETFKPEQIKTRYGKLISANYIAAKGHKWYDGHPVGSWTDDTQLSIAVADALIEKPTRISPSLIAKKHVETLEKYGEAGWGGTSKRAVKRLAEGVSYKKSSYEEGKSFSGCGNGTAMKAGPIGAFLCSSQNEEGRDIRDISRVSLTTHSTSMAVSATLAHAFAVKYCLLTEPEEFSRSKFIGNVIRYSAIGSLFASETRTEDDLTERFYSLSLSEKFTRKMILEQFGGGSCYVYNSLPFTYMFFIKNFMKFQTILNIINAGGDSDSNASMAACLLGALHGVSIFPKKLIDTIHDKDAVESTVERFCDIFAEK